MISEPEYFINIYIDHSLSCSISEPEYFINIYIDHSLSCSISVPDILHFNTELLRHRKNK